MKADPLRFINEPAYWALNPHPTILACMVLSVNLAFVYGNDGQVNCDVLVKVEKAALLVPTLVAFVKTPAIVSLVTLGLNITYPIPVVPRAKVPLVNTVTFCDGSGNSSAGIQAP